MIAIDWGTTSLRAYLVDSGEVVSSRSTTQGVLSLDPIEFRRVFDDITQDWTGDIYLSGMVGSSKGWLETPYCDTPFWLPSLSERLIDISHLTDRPAWIVPGVKQPSPLNMMRGEEVQTLGAIATQPSADCIILCGTHSKHVLVSKEMLTHFDTFMTGELYSILQQHSILAGTEEWNESDFLFGVSDSASSQSLLQQLFTVRANTLSNAIRFPRAYLSGLLIGTEIHNATLLKSARSCTIVGSKRLMALYKLALSTSHPKIQVFLLPSDKATLTGLEIIQRRHRDTI